MASVSDRSKEYEVNRLINDATKAQYIMTTRKRLEELYNQAWEDGYLRGSVDKY